MRFKSFLSFTIVSVLLFSNCAAVNAKENDVAKISYKSNDDAVTISYTSFSDAWHKATQLAKQNEVIFTLLDDWTGNGNLGSGDGFKNGAIYCNNKYPVTIDLNGHTIDRGLISPVDYGEVISVVSELTISDSSKNNDSTEIITGGIITGGCSNNAGGGIVITDKGVLNFNGGTILNCTSKEKGGAIALSSSKGKLNVDGGHFYGNRVYERSLGECLGGAIYNGSGNVIIHDATFDGNYSEDDAGAIYSDGGKLSIDNSIFNGNSAKEKGGAIFFENESVLSVTNTIFSNNESKDDAGAIYCDDGNITIENSSFESNAVTSGSGGALFINEDASANIRNTEFECNDAKENGGAIYSNCEHSVQLYEVNLYENTCGLNGGSIFNKGDEMYFIGLDCENNTADKQGGGVYIVHSADINIAGRVIIQNNTAKDKQSDLCLSQGFFSDAKLYCGGLEDGSSVYLCTTGNDSEKVISDIMDSQFDSYFHADENNHFTIKSDTIEESNIRAVGSVLGNGEVKAIILMSMMIIIVIIMLYMKKRKGDKNEIQ